MKNIFRALVVVIILCAGKNVLTAQGDQLNKLPIVFHKKYDMRLLGLENFHPFDTKKYGRVHSHLMGTLGVNPEQFYKPEKVSEQDLLLVHTSEYLASLRTSLTIARIAEVGALRYVPNFLLRWFFLTPMKYATGGTILATELALQHGWAINLSGGYHHAKADQGGGFCFYADISIAIQKLWQHNPALKVLIVDLDAHQGNGHEMISGPDKRVAIFDIYNEWVYPLDQEAKRYIDFDHPVRTGVDDQAYLALLKSKLPKAIAKFKPDLIIYNAGTDIYARDRLGRMNVSADGIVERDAFVFAQARGNKIPIAMVLSGGYTRESAGAIGRSVEGIVRQYR